MLLKDKVAIVTGGARGIGKGIALRFAREGCSVAIVDLRVKEADKALAEISAEGGKGLSIQCDVADGKQVKRMISEVVEKFGKVDILVNNAGIGHNPHPSAADIPEEEWDKIQSVNLKSVFLCCKTMIPYMRERNYGKIVNVSSIGAVWPPAPSADYVASKAGVLGLSNDLAIQLAPFNISVNTILPGLIRTELWQNLIPPGANEDEFFANLSKKYVPMQRMGTPDDIAGVALFFASDLSAYVTAAQVIVGGGMPFMYFQF